MAKDFKNLDVSPNDVMLDENNPRTHPDYQIDKLARAIKEFGFTNPIIISNDFQLVAGHGRLMAAARLDLKRVPARMFLRDLSPQEISIIQIADNAIGDDSIFDDEMLAEKLLALREGEADLSETGLSKDTIDAILGELSGLADDDRYTSKIEAPVYEITGERPKVSDLFDDKKAMRLIEAVRGAKLPKPLTEFLILAAWRHVVFDYAKIAEYYAHADSELQGLFEASALVIIDMERAIEDGFVVLTEDIKEQYGIDYA